MPEHLIRLRGPWDLIVETDSGSSTTRLALPTDQLPRSEQPIRLRRRFGSPLRFREDYPCSLRAEGVPGLLELRLNGTPLPIRPDAGSEPVEGVEVTVGPLLRPRNLLELTVSGLSHDTGETGLPWGSISLVFDPGAESTG